jgi:hypothetical protein
LQNATSSNAASNNLNNSVTTPTSTMTRTHQYKKVNYIELSTTGRTSYIIQNGQI